MPKTGPGLHSEQGREGEVFQYKIFPGVRKTQGLRTQTCGKWTFWSTEIKKKAKSGSKSCTLLKSGFDSVGAVEGFQGGEQLQISFWKMAPKGRHFNCIYQGDWLQSVFSCFAAFFLGSLWSSFGLTIFFFLPICWFPLMVKDYLFCYVLFGPHLAMVRGCPSSAQETRRCLGWNPVLSHLPGPRNLE